ncbi:MAG: hypothetical protein K2K96_05735 [Lachnospiraceae bacterium]|nr:hypothetical protein [Lachnospiraceae bacterium]
MKVDHKGRSLLSCRLKVPGRLCRVCRRYRQAYESLMHDAGTEYERNRWLWV